MQPFKVRVARTLRALRKEAGLTQAQLAERVGEDCAWETISRFERGALVPSFDWIERICVVLGTDIDAFFATVGGNPTAALRAPDPLLETAVADLRKLRGRDLDAAAHVLRVLGGAGMSDTEGGSERRR
jgi:transcriptional regulator with XRE-family HTH domain